ncbi:MAG TPA: TRAP transporter substrate-binding protein DctP [Ramlibacter sp.]|nr:TRAP transporter substrate-binding protein DctP [Ramlibacter sp.]
MRANRILAVSAVIAGSLLATTPSLAAEKLVITTNVPPQHWASTQGAEPFMACVKKASNGGIDFNYFPGGQLQNFNNSLEVVNDGLAQISYLVISALSGKMPITGITMLPALGNNVVEMTRATRKVIDADGPFRKEFADNKVRPLFINVFPPYQMILKSGPLESPKDFQGKKILSGGSTMSFAVRALGSSPVEIPVADMYMAVQQGTVDGVVLALASVKPYKLEEIAKSMTTNAHLGSAAGIWAIDQGVWNKLSPPNQKALNDCGRQTEEHIAKWVDEFTLKLQTELASSGVKLYSLSTAAKAEFAKRLEPATEEYVGRLAKRGLPAQAAMDMYRKALGQ